MGCMFSQLAAKFAFFPPSPPTYEIKKKDNGKLSVVSSASPIPLPLADDNSLDVLSIDTRKGNKIVAFYLKNPYARLTLLYSHGNAADLGQLYDLFVQLKLNLRVNIMGYDYSGYGASTGKPSEANTYADIEAVYECLQTEYGVGQEDIILYGQSVGSGPTLHLAAKLPRLRGVVLHSGILSGLRVLCHVKFTFCVDIYKNISKIQKVKSPVLVIHGTEDDVVNWLHGNGLWNMAREAYEPLWIKGGGHCNLELYPDFIRHLHRFIREMETMTTKIRLKKIRENLRLKRRSKIAPYRCCMLKLWRPKCTQCLRPRCINCRWRPKCSGCWKANCKKCSCWLPKCSGCWKPSCGKCCWRPRCLNCCCFRVAHVHACNVAGTRGRRMSQAQNHIWDSGETLKGKDGKKGRKEEDGERVREECSGFTRGDRWQLAVVKKEADDDTRRVKMTPRGINENNKSTNQEAPAGEARIANA